MWPKLLLQLVEFLPHATRLMPLADRYLNANAANASSTEALAATERTILDLTERGMQANAAALNGVSEQVQGSLGKVARAHIEMAAKLDEFAGQVNGIAGQVAEITTEAKRARRAAEIAQTRVDALEKQLASVRTLLIAGLAIVAVLLVVIIVLLFRSHINTAF